MLDARCVKRFQSALCKRIDDVVAGFGAGRDGDGQAERPAIQPGGGRTAVRYLRIARFAGGAARDVDRNGLRRNPVLAGNGDRASNRDGRGGKIDDRWAGRQHGKRPVVTGTGDAAVGSQQATDAIRLVHLACDGRPGKILCEIARAIGYDVWNRYGDDSLVAHSGILVAISRRDGEAQLLICREVRAMHNRVLANWPPGIAIILTGIDHTAIPVDDRRASSRVCCRRDKRSQSQEGNTHQRGCYYTHREACTSCDRLICWHILHSNTFLPACQYEQVSCSIC